MGTLADTFRARLAEFMAAHAPTRVLVGGLPDFFIERIAKGWGRGVDLYFVTSAGVTGLPLNVIVCRADDLTAERQDGWVALVSAHESRGIQESIRGAGAGTVREIWQVGFPWKPCELPRVRWSDVRNDFIDRLGLTAIREQAANCIDRFLEELRGEVDGPIRFFSALDSLSGPGVSYEDLCFELGFPAHVPGRALRERNNNECVLSLLDEFVETFKDDGADDALAFFLDVASTRFAGDPAKPAIEAALKFFANEFRHISPADAENSVRTWRAVYTASRGHWQTISDQVLAALIGPGDQRATFAKCEIVGGNGVQLLSVGDNQIVARDGNCAAPAVNADFEFSQALVTQASDAAANGAPWKLFARVNRQMSQLASPLPGGKGPYQFAVALQSEGKQAIRFVVGPTTANEKAASKTLTLWECCKDFPLIVASAHAKLRAGKRKRSKDESGNTRYDLEQDMVLPAQGRVVLHGFIFGLPGELLKTLPGESAASPVAGLTAIPQSNCKQFVLNIDVVEGSELIFEWVDRIGIPHRATISFDFKAEVGAGDDSMSGVLLRAHGGAGSKALKEHLEKLKRGKKLPAGELAVKQTPKPIAFWEVHQQDTVNGWWPILVSQAHEVREQKLHQNQATACFVSTSLLLDEQANAWKSVVESTITNGPVPAAITGYATARARVIEALAAQFALVPNESVSDLNIARLSAVGVLSPILLKDYLDAFAALLNAARQNSLPVPWRWHAWAADSVLLFAPEKTGPSAHLLGPFHPITLARLFFVQRCLTERLLDDDPCTLAHVLSDAQPIAAGHVLDAQLQPAQAIAFPTGEVHWLWLYRQQVQSDLPAVELVDWLRVAGLDPQTGPLGVDAEVLPQTLKQYTLAYPSRQTLRLSLEDCSQRTFQVLRSELMPDEEMDSGDEALRQKLTGGISVYDPVTKVKRVDGEILSYEPELPMRWHHAKPPDSLPIDLATLQRSNRVDFQERQRGGVCSASLPTARRSLVDVGPGGLEVANALDQVTSVNLETAAIEALRLFEPIGRQLSWGTSLSPNTSPKANWTLCSTGQVDPRLFIDYVRSNPGTALWTYRLFSIGNSKVPEFGRGHFLIARVSPSLSGSLQSHLTGAGLSAHPNDLLSALAQAGLTLGDEFLRTGRAAEGALGQYLVERLAWQPAGDSAPLPHWSTSPDGTINGAGFLLQVDPFASVLEALAKVISQGAGVALNSNQRSDLISFHLQFCDDELWIRPVVLESKCYPNSVPNIPNALAQAEATAALVDKLLDYCQFDCRPHEAFWAQPERLLLAELIHLGLRLARGSFSGSADAWHDFERRVLRKVLSGDYRRDDAGAIAIVHHNSATANNLATSQPHALVSFGDADAARTGTAPPAYASVQQSLAEVLRHTCGKRSASPATPPPPPPATQSIAVGTGVSQQQQEPPPSFGALPPPPSPANPPPPAPAKVAVSVSQAGAANIGAAHAAFDAAFGDFIGNRQAIEKLRDDIVDALIKQPPHLPSAYILTGNPSTGKTTLANKVAKLLGVTFVKLVGTNIRNEAELVKQVDNAFEASGRPPKVTAHGSQGVPEHEYGECLIFIDEIHLVKGKAQEGLLTLTEPKDRYIRLSDKICRFPRATYMAATTRDSEIDKALRTRFGNPIHLKDYSVAEVANMLEVKNELWARWDEEIRSGIAQLARCIPREAERLAQKLERKLNVSRERLTMPEALEKLRVEEGLDRNGLDHVCWAALRHLAKQSRPIGRDTLAKQLGTTDEDKLVSEVVPALQTLGLVNQVAGGQVITDRGRNYLRNEPPPSGM